MFSYEDYKEIIRIIQSTGNQAGYEEALKADKFVIMRHDVEYSVDRAYALAKVESSMDFTSTFFFQWTNNSYNILSRQSRSVNQSSWCIILIYSPEACRTASFQFPVAPLRTAFRT